MVADVNGSSPKFRISTVGKIELEQLMPLGVIMFEIPASFNTFGETTQNGSVVVNPKSPLGAVI